jgi:hypothetical protein
MKANVDMDLVVYAIGSILDGKYYTYKGEKYESKVELNIVMKEDGIDEIIEPQFDPAPWEEEGKPALINYVEELFENFSDYQGYLSGKGNFRYEVATILPYKGNRSLTRKPYHYDNIRQFLVDTYDCILSRGQEADDDLGQAQTDSTILASNDKDLNSIPGHHYNWSIGKSVAKSYEISKVEAKRNFFSQCLTGDATDNILGLFGVGVKSTHVKALSQMEVDEDMYQLVLGQYDKRFGSYAERFLLENSQLLWIRQAESNPVADRLVGS